MDRAKLREELVRDEGRRLKAYRDSVGLWTIGVGHLLGREPRMTEINDMEADALLDLDVRIAEAGAALLVDGFDKLSDVRQRALVNMAFNLGNRLLGFRKFLAAVNVGDWTQAAFEMMDSKWATQVGKRAERLRDMVLLG